MTKRLTLLFAPQGATTSFFYQLSISKRLLDLKLHVFSMPAFSLLATFKGSPSLFNSPCLLKIIPLNLIRQN